LLVIAAVAALTYSWAISSTVVEPFYGAAVRSMSESWRSFFFGAFDPWGTVTIDKLPGAFWVQALFVRLFGFQIWTLVLPQVVEGTLTVLVLFRAVRRLAGPGAGLIAAVVMAASPATILLNRGNISDSLLILCLVLAADAISRAIVSGRWQSVVVAALWVGIGFQAKMTQAWLVLPALALVYFVAAPERKAGRRLRRIGMLMALAGVVSLSFISFVSLVPAHDRPAVDGSRSNSEFAQVFLYNGYFHLVENKVAFVRDVGTPSPILEALDHQSAQAGASPDNIKSGWDRLLVGEFGRDSGGMLPVALIAGCAILIARRKSPRTDALRAVSILWMSWLVFTAVFFSSGNYLNSYYLAALAPAIAALIGTAATMAWRARRNSRGVRIAAVVFVPLAGAYAALLIPPGLAAGKAIYPAILIVSLLAEATLIASLFRKHASLWTTTIGLGLALLALCVGPIAASASIVVDGLGPFDTPYQPAFVGHVDRQLQQFELSLEGQVAKKLRHLSTKDAPIVVDTSFLASYATLATGREFLPVGGYDGAGNTPSLKMFTSLVHEGRVNGVMVPTRPNVNNDIFQWVVVSCTRGPAISAPVASIQFRLYSCHGG
jgi:4-amino-4-deoxy-L-arabinose transferase-like glycosyltransferase